MFFAPGQQFVEIGDARGGERLDGAGGEAVDADAFRANAGGEVVNAGFQAGFGQAHDVVMRHRAHRTEIAHG